MWKNTLRSLTHRRKPPLTTTTISAATSTTHSNLPTTQSPISHQFSRQISHSPSPFLREKNLGFHQNSFFCSVSSQNLRCWSCNSVFSENNTTPFLVCNACGCVQPLDESVDYFRIFGLEKKYEMEGENLERKYKDWQRKLHPDLVHTKSEKEREYAAEQSARVIDAYRTLTDPLSRAIYILKLEGVHVDEEERIDDLDLLAEIMEIRETVEEAADSQALKQIQGQIHGKLEKSSLSFADALRSREYEEAVAAMRRMTYYKRANEEISRKL